MLPLATAAVADATQIHTHMCYAEFGDIMDAVVALDVDVISIEAARTQMDLLVDLAAVHYRAGIGLGVYDIHSPTVPSTDEMAAFIGPGPGRPAGRPALGQPRLRPEDPPGPRGGGRPDPHGGGGRPDPRRPSGRRCVRIESAP